MILVSLLSARKYTVSYRNRSQDAIVNSLYVYKCTDVLLTSYILIELAMLLILIKYNRYSIAIDDNKHVDEGIIIIKSYVLINHTAGGY